MAEDNTIFVLQKALRAHKAKVTRASDWEGTVICQPIAFHACDPTEIMAISLDLSHLKLDED
ncbi:MAG: hypothetical protein ACLFQA_03695 [Bacteroidales bacterium]